MNLITWNTQWCRGIDGRVDPVRIARTALEMANFDVLCLQEIAVNFPALDGGRGADQVDELSKVLPRYSAHFGAAVDIDDGQGGRSRFGNLIFSRLPVTQLYRHLLPWPPDPATASMQRVAVEAVIEAPWGTLRVTTTHLEYYSTRQRTAQIDALRGLHVEACGHARLPRDPGDPGTPFEAQPRGASAILTGDFNFTPETAEHAHMTGLFDDSVPRYFDAWTIAHPDTANAPTVGIHENSFADKPSCFDFFFVTPDIAARVQSMRVDPATQASDHQPVLLELRD